MSPLDPVNPFYCILVLCIYTIYVSGKLGQGGTYFKIENGDDPFFIRINTCFYDAYEQLDKTEASLF